MQTHDEWWATTGHTYARKIAMCRRGHYQGPEVLLDAEDIYQMVWVASREHWGKPWPELRRAIWSTVSLGIDHAARGWRIYAKARGGWHQVDMDRVAARRPRRKSSRQAALEARVLEALSACHPKQRTAVDLTYLQGMTLDQAAAHLGVTQRTVVRHKVAGIAALKQALGVAA